MSSTRGEMSKSETCECCCRLMSSDHDAVTEAQRRARRRRLQKRLRERSRRNRLDTDLRYDPRPEIHCRFCFVEEMDSLMLPCLHAYACYSCLLDRNATRCDLCERRVDEIVPIEIHHAPR